MSIIRELKVSESNKSLRETAIAILLLKFSIQVFSLFNNLTCFHLRFSSSFTLPRRPTVGDHFACSHPASALFLLQHHFSLHLINRFTFSFSHVHLRVTSFLREALFVSRCTCSTHARAWIKNTTEHREGERKRETEIGLRKKKGIKKRQERWRQRVDQVGGGYVWLHKASIFKWI